MGSNMIAAQSGGRAPRSHRAFVSSGAGAARQLGAGWGRQRLQGGQVLWVGSWGLGVDSGEGGDGLRQADGRAGTSTADPK